MSCFSRGLILMLKNKSSKQYCLLWLIVTEKKEGEEKPEDEKTEEEKKAEKEKKEKEEKEKKEKERKKHS